MAKPNNPLDIFPDGGKVFATNLIERNFIPLSGISLAMFFFRVEADVLMGSKPILT